MIEPLSGGCQCGKVRYVARPLNDDAYLCHCRMCQRATGGFAAACVSIAAAAVEWRSGPDWYASSPIARRAFCAACGTPLGFCYTDDSDHLDLTVGSFDDPSGFVPTSHTGTESLLEMWLDTSGLPRSRSDESAALGKRWEAVGRHVP